MSLVAIISYSMSCMVKNILSQRIRYNSLNAKIYLGDQGFMVRRSLVGGNSNNASRVGGLYTNLNNAVSNADWNVGASILILVRVVNISSMIFIMYHIFLSSC